MRPLRLLLLAGLLISAGCTYEDDPDLRPGHAAHTFKLVTSDPVAGAVGVARNAPLELTFNIPPDGDTATTARVRLFSGLYSILGAVRTDLLERTITFTPGSSLRPNLRYILHISSAVRGVNGAVLAASASVDFTTGEQLRTPSPAKPPPPTGKEVQPVWTAHCARCHAGTSAPMGLRLESGPAVQATAVDQPASVGSRRRVLAGDHARSYLMLKLLDMGGISGSLMPPGGPALPLADLTRLARWIDNGARP